MSTVTFSLPKLTFSTGLPSDFFQLTNNLEAYVPKSISIVSPAFFSR